jgi:hypothetical protein
VLKYLLIAFHHHLAHCSMLLTQHTINIEANVFTQSPIAHHLKIYTDVPPYPLDQYLQFQLPVFHCKKLKN